MDLIVRNARLADRPSGELIDIGVEQGRIVALEHALAAEAEVYDAKGCLACPGLIETHIHLDKSGERRFTTEGEHVGRGRARARRAHTARLHQARYHPNA